MKSLKNFFKWTRDNQAKFAEAVSAEFDKKAGLDSPKFTGTPTAPTADPGTNTGQIATTEFVTKSSSDKVSKSGDTITGELTVGLPMGSGGTTFPLVLKGKYNNTGSDYIWRLGLSTVGTIFYIRYNTQNVIGIAPVLGLFPAAKNLSLGHSGGTPWANVYTQKLNNGADIEIPNKTGTLALLSDIPEVSEIDTSALVAKDGDAMSGALKIQTSTDQLYLGTDSTNARFNFTKSSLKIRFAGSGFEWLSQTINSKTTFAFCGGDNTPTIDYNIGKSNFLWNAAFIKKLNNGADIEIPNKAGTLALLSDIEDILRQHNLI